MTVLTNARSRSARTVEPANVVAAADPVDRSKRFSTLLQGRHTQIARVARYAATSGVAFGVSETTLLILYGNAIADATIAAVIANLVATVPSYLMSRYWIWKDSNRTRVRRQVVLYWAVSLICLALTSVATGAIASLAPAGHRFHLAVVAVGFPAVTIVFWLAKFFVYQRVIFPAARADTARAAS
jgi:putative flippase GtrA